MRDTPAPPLRIHLVELRQAAVGRIDPISGDAAVFAAVEIGHFAGDIQRLAIGAQRQLRRIRHFADQRSVAQRAAGRIDLHPVNAFAVGIVGADIGEMR